MYLDDHGYMTVDPIIPDTPLEHGFAEDMGNIPNPVYLDCPNCGRPLATVSPHSSGVIAVCCRKCRQDVTLNLTKLTTKRLPRIGF